MKRVNNKSLKLVIMSSLITAIIVGSIGVIAASLSAKDIGFTSTNEEWQVNNVEDAINDLYESDTVETGTFEALDYSTTITIDCGFKPSKVFLVSSVANRYFWLMHNADYSNSIFMANNGNASGQNYQYLTITDNGFTYKPYQISLSNTTVHYVAAK